MIVRVKRFLSELPTPVVVAAVPVIGLVDYLLGPDVRMTLLYFLPLIKLAWANGKRVGPTTAVFIGVIAFLAYAGQASWRESPGAALWNFAMIAGSFWVVAALADSLQQALSQEKSAANTDSVTGLLNQRGFFRMARAELARARRYQRPIVFAFIDLDHFKQVNDCLGHAAGDEVLQQVARIARRTLREQDVVARVGGDEFAILLPETHQRQAEAALHRLRYHLMERMEMNGLPVTFSIGAVVFDRAPETVQEALDHADAVQYRAKHEGKDRIYIDEVPVRAPAAAAVQMRDGGNAWIEGDAPAPDEPRRPSGTQRGRDSGSRAPEEGAGGPAGLTRRADDERRPPRSPA